MIVLLSVFVIADSGVYDNVNHNEYNIYNISNATSDYFIGDGSLLTNLNESDLNGSLLNVNSSTYWDSEISQSDLNVNASDYWDLLNSPTDITSLGTIGSATSITSTSFTGPLTGTASIATLWASVSSFNLTQFFDSGNVLIINSTWITNLITGFSYATEADLTTEENLQAANNATQAALINLKIDTSSEGDLNVNSSDYWDSLGSPSDITGLSDSQISSLSWSKLSSYPVSCPPNTYITQLNDSITCTGINQTMINDSIESYGYVPYTGANQDIDLGANDLTINTNTLFVNATSGNVGIGTTSPEATLDVAGNIKANAFQPLQYNLGNDIYYYLLGNLNGAGARVGLEIIGQNGYGDPATDITRAAVSIGNVDDEYNAWQYSYGNYVASKPTIIWDDNGVGTTNVDVYVKLGQYFRGSVQIIDAYGFTLDSAPTTPVSDPSGTNAADGFILKSDVGIGISTPNGVFHIYDSPNTLLPIQSGGVDGNYAGLKFKVSANTDNSFYYAGILAERRVDNLLDLHFSLGIDGSDPAYAKMTITNPGNVGIGTTSPSSKLDVNGSINVSDSSGKLYAPEICLNGDCQVAWPSVSGASSSAGWTNDSTSTSTSLDVNVNSGKLFVNATSGNVGIGTTSPSYPLEVVGSTSGISGYFEANVSAEGFIDRTKGWNGTSNEALKELIKIKSSNGEINHTTMPEFAKASYKEPIRNYINETYEEEICETIMINETKEECNNITVYEDYFYEEKQCEYKKGENTYYNYVCNNIMKIGTRPKEGCYNETRTEWETIKVENKTFYEPKQVIYEVCEEVIIEECKNINYQEPLLECHNETRTRIVEEVTLVEQEGRDLGAMITLLTESVKALQEENDLIRKELCEKDNTYSWCKQDLGVI